MIKGLDQLQRQVSEAEAAVQQLAGELGVVNFDPEDPGSIDAAIVTASAIIDSRLGKFASNPFVAPLIDQTKNAFRNQILEEAAAARLRNASGE